MASVSELIVREFFELQGYLVSQPCKYIPGGRRRPEEEPALLALNPRLPAARLPDHPVWSAADLQTVPRAVIGVCGWHTDRFYPKTLEQIPEILRFAGDDALRLAARRLGGAPAKILCLSQLPASEKLKTDTLKLLRARGIDGVLLFEVMLRALCDGVDRHRHYEKSDLLQLLRILKNYDLVKPPQMELFDRRRPRRQPPAAPETPA